MNGAPLEGILGWFVRTVPLQIFFLFLFLSPDRFLIANSFPALYHGVFYYWLIYRPENLSLAPLLLGTLFFDALVGYRLGQTFFELFIFMMGVLYQRKYLMHAPFIVIWACFVFCMAIFVICAMVAHYIDNNLLLCLDLLYSFTWVSISYPLLSWGLEKIARLSHHVHA